MHLFWFEKDWEEFIAKLLAVVEGVKEDLEFIEPEILPIQHLVSWGFLRKCEFMQEGTELGLLRSWISWKQFLWRTWQISQFVSPGDSVVLVFRSLCGCVSPSDGCCSVTWSLVIGVFSESRCGHTDGRRRGECLTVYVWVWAGWSMLGKVRSWFRHRWVVLGSSMFQLAEVSLPLFHPKQRNHLWGSCHMNLSKLFLLAFVAHLDFSYIFKSWLEDLFALFLPLYFWFI